MITADPQIFSAVRFTDLVSDFLPIPAMKSLGYFQSAANADSGADFFANQSLVANLRPRSGDEVSTESGSDRVSPCDSGSSVELRPGRYRSRY